MSTATAAAVVIAAVAVLTLAGGVLALVYRTGRLVGHVEALIAAGAERDARLDKDIASLTASLAAHIAHRHTRRRPR